MTKRMLVDATHPEETRVAIVDSYRDNNRLDDLDFALASKPVLRGNIYLAKVMRIEPSLQAAFVEYGGNRHGFLPFSEIHADYFRIPMADRPQDEDAATEEDADGENLNDPSPDDLEGGPEDETQDNQDSKNTTAPAESAPLAPEGETPDAPPSVFGNDELHEGLITDFGNAVVSSMTDVPMPQTPVESVGGDMTERVVRRHRPRYKIQEVLKRGQIMLIQVVKEERGNKGAALTTYLSLAGRYCVLMPNTDHGGGVSRKITNHQDRRRMKEVLDQLEIPEGMAVILRTAGMEMEPQEIQRDLDYLLRLWDNIREQTLQSNAPALIYEEANLIKRSIRDLYSSDINEILVAGNEGYDRAKEFMSALMPDDMNKIKLYSDSIPLFFRYHVENQIDKLQSPVVQLRSGGYIVINPTEALVAIDVNSGRATRERHIEETALKTNLEAADEIARQLRLRDLAGLIVIDFIDMEDGRNNAAVERRLKEAMKTDRARLQIGRISPFGLLELSRQRLRPSLLEMNFEKCPHCAGTGYVRLVDSAALSILRLIEEEGIKQRSAELTMHIPVKVALFLLNQKREALRDIEQRYDLHVMLFGDDSLVPPDYRLEKSRQRTSGRKGAPAVNADQILAESERFHHQEQDEPSEEGRELSGENRSPEDTAVQNSDEPSNGFGSRKRRFRQRGREGRRNKDHSDQLQNQFSAPAEDSPRDAMDHETGEYGINGNAAESQESGFEGSSAENQNDAAQRRRRRGRRGGRRRGNGNEGQGGDRFNRRDQQKQGWGNAPKDFTSAPQPSPEWSAPSFSVHEIDTTPRTEAVSPAPFKPALTESAPARESLPRDERQPDRQNQNLAAAYEVINPPSDRPKGGWWRRLTGHE